MLGFFQGVDAALYFPAGQALRVAGEFQLRVVRFDRFEDLQIERVVEEVAIDLVHVGLEQAVLAAVGEVGVVGVGVFGV